MRNERVGDYGIRQNISKPQDEQLLLVDGKGHNESAYTKHFKRSVQFKGTQGTDHKLDTTHKCSKLSAK